MKRLIIGVVGLFIVLSFSGCGKKPIPPEKVLSEKYMIDGYIKKALSKYPKHSQVYQYSKSQVIPSTLGYKSILKDFKNEIKLTNNSLTAVCSNHSGTIVKTTHKDFNKFYLSNNILRDTKACKVNERELFAYSFGQPYTTRGAHPSNVYWNYKMVLVKFNEKDHQEKIKNDKKEKERQLELEKEKKAKEKERVAKLRKNCNAKFINKEAIKSCNGVIRKIYSTNEKCVDELREAVFTTYKCQDGSVLEEMKLRDEALKIKEKRLIEEKKKVKPKDVCGLNLMQIIDVRMRCEHNQFIYNTNNYSQCVDKGFSKERKRQGCKY